MTTFDQLSNQIDERRAAAERRRAAAERGVRSITSQAQAEGRSALTPDEDLRVDEFLGRAGSAIRELRSLEGQVGEVNAALAHEAEIARRTLQTHVPAGFPVNRVGGQRASFSVGRNERTYRPDNDPKGVLFLRDVAANFMTRDPRAADRLMRHQMEEDVERAGYMRGLTERAAGDVTTSNWAGLTVPQYLVDMFAPAVANLRPLADIAMPHDLPPAGMSINISTVTTPTSAALQSSELGAISTQTIDDTLLTEPVQTAAGTVKLSRQAIDRGSGIEEVTTEDLMRRIATVIDSTMINQATTGALATGQTSSYTDATPTAPELWPSIFQAQSLLEQALVGVAVPDYLLMHSRRLNWLASQVGSTWPFMGSPGVGVQQGGLILSNDYTSPVRAVLSNGLRVITDNNLPTNLGVGTNQDPLLLVASREIHLWTDPSAPVLIRAEQPAAPNLGVLLVAWTYFAYTCRRYANNPGIVNGTGLVAPAGF